jgi:hypothetical protein
MIQENPLNLKIKALRSQFREVRNTRTLLFRLINIYILNFPTHRLYGNLLNRKLELLLALVQLINPVVIRNSIYLFKPTFIVRTYPK